ncbi:RNA polymerase-binding transcription factor DksA [bacterium BMS3Abin03]|nr:RNA polymerase-binding transcription factor DksA [bacterium BMS3Abin03]
MAEKTTTKKKTTKKSSVKGKSKVTKKKTIMKTAPKTTAKKKATKKAVTGKTTTKKTAAKKHAAKKTTAKKAVSKKKTTAKKAVSKKKTTAKKAGTKKPVTKKAAAVKKPAAKTIETKTRKKAAMKVREEKTPVQTRAEAIKKIKGYSKKDLEHFKSIILEKREEILDDLQSLKEQMLDPATGEYINENSPYSLHMAEQGTDAMEREKTFLYAQRENKFLGYLDAALKRIELGTYGICIECIEEPQHLCETCPLVPKARLEAVPHTQHCLPIKQRKDKR